MQDINFPLTADGGPDDLPRTLRRERERQARERDPSALGAASFPAAETGLHQPVRAAVTRFDVPFYRLVMFFIKAAFAAVPGILVLGGILWAIGFALQKYFPQLVKMQILIWFPN